MFSCLVANWFIDRVSGGDALMVLVPDTFVGGKNRGHIVYVLNARRHPSKKKTWASPPTAPGTSACTTRTAQGGYETSARASRVATRVEGVLMKGVGKLLE
jgi:hypothetical protein